MRRKFARRLLTSLLAAAMMAGMCLTASAFEYPNSYWPLQDEWIAASESQDPDRVIASAQKIYDMLRPYGLNQDVCENLEPKCAMASWAYEIKGDLDNAILWLERQVELASWLNANGSDRRDTLLNAGPRMDYLKAARDVTIYAQSNDDPSPYAVGPKTGTWYGVPADNPNGHGSAALIYMEFGDSYGADHWIEYYTETSELFRQAANGGVVEVAWNFQPSTYGCQQVLSADSYIEENLQALGSLNATVLLRCGAEMNNWAECDPATFIQAFQKIAVSARKYDNIQMVFSPDNINNRAVTVEQYYPGDAYVDWVGLSSYHRTNYAGYAGQPSDYTMGNNTYGNNAYYGEGIYDYDPLVILRHIVELARAHGKPVMVSECGFSYWNGSQDTTDYAADQVNKFYSYINMIYPEVKAVFYFDIPREIEVYHYGLSGNSAVKSAYETAITANGAYLETADGSATGWENLSQTQLTQTGSLKLATYASFPGVKNATVQYYVDGALAATSTKAPYYFYLNTNALSAGNHTVYAVASGNQFSRTSPTYTINVPGTVVPEEPEEPDTNQTPSGWAQALIDEAAGKDLVTERTQGRYHDKITRLQFAELAVNLIERTTGKEIVPAEDNFDDTDDVMALKAVAAGVASGKGEGVFAPDAAITRQEICVMLNQVIKYVDEANGTTTLENNDTQVDAERFNDAADVASWASESVALLTNNGLMAGKGGGVAPKANTTVEEAIILVLALSNKF